MNMKETNPMMLVMLAVILVGLLSGPAVRPADAAVIQFNEFQITSDTAAQENPDIDGIRIVYQDNRNGNWDIYLYTLQGVFEPESRLTTDPANQINPAISGDKIVYQDDRNGNWDIYMYDLTTQIETRITDNAFTQEHPAIDGNRIVWQDNRNVTAGCPWCPAWDVYMYDLSAQTERRVTPSGSALSGTNPAISGTRIAYLIDRDVYYFDLSSGNEVRLTWNGYYVPQKNIAIYGSHIVWSVEAAGMEFPYMQYDVHMQDVESGVSWSPWTRGREEDFPDISEIQDGVYYIVYQTMVNGNWDIYLYQTGTGTEYRVTTIAANQVKPKVSGGYIVYMDDRNGNWDIYMTMVSYMPGGGGPSTPQAAIQQIQGIQNLVADPAEIPTNDLVGANGRVKDNRRDALLNKLDAVIASIQAAADSTDPARRTAGYQGAIDQLNSILDKTDGCALRGTPDGAGPGVTPDWITTCASQELIEPQIRDALTILQTLLPQS